MGISKMINEQVVVKGGVRGFVDPETGVWLPIGEAEPPVIRGQGGRPLNSTRPQRNPSTSTSTPEPTPEPDKKPIPRGLGLGAQSGEPVIGTPVDSYTPPTPSPTPTSDLKIIRNKDGTVATKYTKNSAGDTPMQQWAKNFPKLAAKVKPGKAGYKEIRSVSNPATAATGGVNPRAGSYAMMQKANMDNLTSNFGASPVGTIKPVAKRTMKQEAYDLVLDYLLSEGHVDTVEEAHYVMLQMTSEHVQEVVEERTAADPKMKARMGHSNPAINGKPVPYPKGHPKAGEHMSFNKAETDGVNEYRRASKKAGRKIYADEPLPKK